eukprot:5237824-Amphidinium_carterae.1
MYGHAMWKNQHIRRTQKNLMLQYGSWCYTDITPKLSDYMRNALLRRPDPTMAKLYPGSAVSSNYSTPEVDCIVSTRATKGTSRSERAVCGGKIFLWIRSSTEHHGKQNSHLIPPASKSFAFTW